MRNCRLAGALLLLPMALGLTGCPAVAWIFGVIQGPKEKKALFDLPDDKRVLVLAEDRMQMGGAETVQRELTGFLNQALLSQELVREVVPYSALAALRAETPDFHRLHIAEVGQRLGADVVIYVNVLKFALKDNPADVLWRGHCEVAVKVIQCPAGVKRGKARLWPDHPPRGHPVSHDRAPKADTSSGYEEALSRTLAAETADKIAKLFYTHELKGLEAWEHKPTGGDPRVLQ